MVGGALRRRTKDEAYARVNLPPAEIVVIPPIIVLGPTATVDGKFTGGTLSPPDESGEQFLDLDTGLEPQWPKHIPEDKAAEQEHDIALWAAQHGVDSMCVVYRSPDGTETFALRAFNMRLWEISLRNAEELEELVKRGKLPEGKPAGELLLHRDEQTGNYVPEANAAFLYATPRRGHRRDRGHGPHHAKEGYHRHAPHPSRRRLLQGREVQSHGHRPGEA